MQLQQAMHSLEPNASTRRCLGIICAKQDIHLRVPLPPGHLDVCVACLAQIAHSHRRVRALDPKTGLLPRLQYALPRRV